jgi:hypothetical protein
MGFKKSSSDAAVFYRHGETIIGAAVDDLTITAKNDQVLRGVKKDLSKTFKMKDLGEIHWLLNLKIEREETEKTISFSQESYIDKIIAWFNLQDSKTHTTPLDPNTKLSKDNCPTTEKEKQAM